MNKSKSAKIEAELTRLLEGDLLKPIEVEGVGVTRAIFKRMEALRLSLLRLKDNEVDTARRANNAIASVAHDMKTPLSIIHGYAECLQDGIDDQDYAGLILQRTEQMNDMVLSLIEDSHVALEKTSDQKSLQNTRIYFLEVFNRLRPVAESKGIKLKVKKIPNADIRINSQAFGRVMLNLFTNAVKYSPAGTTITISFRLWAKWLYILVKDEGEGISKESLPYIFDQFFKEDKSRTSGQSNGLGLYITKEIVRDHGGHITVHSKKGKGSTFIVAIPVEPQPKEKLTFTGRFNALPLWGKILIDLFFGWILCAAYRITRFFETRNLSTLFFGLLCLALFPFVWMIDFLSICVYGKIDFLAD